MSELHLVWSRRMERGKLFSREGQLVWAAEMRNRCVHDDYGRWGRCPPGDYPLGVPHPHDDPAFGKWFIPVEGVVGRVGIGIHGGGSGLPDPFAAEQGWVITHGCFRLQNMDLDELVAVLVDTDGSEWWMSVEE